MTFQKYNKAIVGVLSSLVTLLAMFGLDFEVSQELIGAVGTVITGVVVYFVPNKSE